MPHRVSKLALWSLLSAFACIPCDSAIAQEMPAAVGKWFDALRSADRNGFEAVLADKAEIDLRYLGIVQTRTEFIESLDAWGEAIRYGEVLTKTVSADAQSAVVDVCYRFPSNEKVNRETFTLDTDEIVRVVQEESAQTCDGFGD
jgi:hypothetical protein